MLPVDEWHDRRVDYLLAEKPDGTWEFGRDVTVMDDGDTVWLVSPHLPGWLPLDRARYAALFGAAAQAATT